MKILLITTTYPTPALPRQGAFNRTLVESLRARHEVRVIAPVPWTKSISFSIRNNEFGTLYPVYFYPPKLLREQYHYFYWLSIRSALNRLGKEFTPDAVLGYWLHPDGAAAVRAAKRYRVPSIVMSGGSDLRLLPRQRGRRMSVARVLENADRLIVFSQDLAAQAQLLGMSPQKIDVVYRGVDRNCFSVQDRGVAREACGLPNEALVFFWAGRFEAVKNPKLLLNACQVWKRKWGNRLRVVMAGDGPLRHQLHQLRQQLRLDENVVFTGNLTQGKLAEYYNAADLTVLTSHSEGIPNVLLESIACGTPFVATKVGGVAEIATPGVDHLVSPDDEDALAAAVIEQVQHPRTGQRRFVPTDLAGMADQFDASLARGLSPGESEDLIADEPEKSKPQPHRNLVTEESESKGIRISAANEWIDRTSNVRDVARESV
jgi:teichuronic acid biosynthesis glycosyltransferase TuaC